ncbi:MAG: SDR family oxidoreductase [Sediminispirochaetaceae bacterium]
MNSLPYTRALITGGSSGIGLAAAGYLVNRGVHVTLIARDPDRLNAARKRLLEEASSGTEVRVLPLDITDRRAVEEVLGQVVAAGNTPDLLLNCAGMAYPDYFEGLDSTIFDQTIAVNLTGTWNVLKALVPAMQPGSCIVNFSSIVGFAGLFGYTAYSASKFAVIGLSEALRNELSIRGIRVSVICPPDTDTPQLEQENRTKPYETKAITGNAGLLTPDQVAAALFRGLRRKQFIIIPGTMGKLTYLVKRWIPGLLYRIIDSDAKRAYRRRNNERSRTESR